MRDLRSAVTSSGLSQAGFARALGTSASRLSTYLSGRTVPSAAWFLRAQRLGDALGVARRQSWSTPVTTAPAIQSALAAGDQAWGLRLILQCRDHLRAAFDATDGAHAAWEADPVSVRNDGWDLLFQATIGHEFDSRGLPAPAWTMAPAIGPWLFPSPFFTEIEVRAATPDWMAERGLFIAARDLVTA
jgi:transcriptional regulator with XRE-family HTH domain